MQASSHILLQLPVQRTIMCKPKYTRSGCVQYVISNTGTRTISRVQRRICHTNPKSAHTVLFPNVTIILYYLLHQSLQCAFLFGFTNTQDHWKPHLTHTHIISIQQQSLVRHTWSWIKVASDRTDYLPIVLAPMRQLVAVHATNIPRTTEPASNISWYSQSSKWANAHVLQPHIHSQPLVILIYVVRFRTWAFNSKKGRRKIVQCHLSGSHSTRTRICCFCG